MPFVQISLSAVLVGLLLAAGTGTIVVAQDPPASDDAIARRVAAHLVDQEVTTVAVSMAGNAVMIHGNRWIKGIVPPVHVFVDRGAVTLTGVVYSEVERRKAFRVARGTPGVTSVVNRLRVESVWDDEGDGSGEGPTAAPHAVDPDPDTMCRDNS